VVYRILEVVVFLLFLLCIALLFNVGGIAIKLTNMLMYLESLR